MMIKKLLLIPLMGVISFGAFASADTVDGFTSDSTIYSVSYSTSVGYYDYGDLWIANPSIPVGEKYYVCNFTNDYPLGFGVSNPDPSSNAYVSQNSSYACLPYIQHIGGEEYFSFYEPNCSSLENCNLLESNISGKFYLSTSPITYSSSSDSDSSLGIPGIPENFTSGLTSLVSNFGSTVVNWLPTIILVALGIYAIFALFRVVRNYARSSFNG